MGPDFAKKMTQYVILPEEKETEFVRIFGQGFGEYYEERLSQRASTNIGDMKRYLMHTVHDFPSFEFRCRGVYAVSSRDQIAKMYKRLLHESSLLSKH